MKEIKIIRKNTLDVSKKFYDNSIYIEFKDTLHTFNELNANIDSWYTKIRKGEIISGNSYSIKYMRVAKTVNEKFGEDNIGVF